jgi:hypothetical protein
MFLWVNNLTGEQQSIVHKKTNNKTERVFSLFNSYRRNEVRALLVANRSTFKITCEKMLGPESLDTVFLRDQHI